VTDDEIRRFPAQVHRLEDDKRELLERLGYSWRYAEELRAELLEGERRLQTAAGP